MKAPLYDEVHSLALDIVNASARDDSEMMESAYEVLNDLCFAHENTENDHPLQWEALGDFSHDFSSAIFAYEKGLVSCDKLNLDEYAASIKFAMAEANLEEKHVSIAKQLAAEAEILANNIEDGELAEAIREFNAQF